MDPVLETGLTQHIRQGRESINLLGGLNEDHQETATDVAEEYFDINTTEVPYILGGNFHGIMVI